MNERERRLEEKGLELEEHLEKWASEHLRLERGERVFAEVVLKIVQEPIVTVSMETRRPKAKRISSNLVPGDWERILSITWLNPTERTFIEKQRAHNNAPLNGKLVPNSSYSFIQSLNLKIRNANLPYRFLGVKVHYRDTIFDNMYFQFFRVK